MSRKHRRLTRMWHKSPRRFKHGRTWYRWDTKMPKRVGYRLVLSDMEWRKLLTKNPPA
jgi:hypothetical protein